MSVPFTLAEQTRKHPALILKVMLDAERQLAAESEDDAENSQGVFTTEIVSSVRDIEKFIGSPIYRDYEAEILAGLSASHLSLEQETDILKIRYLQGQISVARFFLNIPHMLIDKLRQIEEEKKVESELKKSKESEDGEHSTSQTFSE